MNVMKGMITALPKQLVQILKEVILVVVMKDILGMVLIV